MSAEPATDEEVPAEDRSRYAGVLRFYELAKRQEWLVKDVPFGVAAFEIREQNGDDPVRVTFTTQTRLKQGGTFARRPDFQLLFRRLLGRMSALARFHDKGPLDVDFRGLIDAAGGGGRTQARCCRRCSPPGSRHARPARGGLPPTASSKETVMNFKRSALVLAVLMLAAVYEGDLAPFWPYLVFGQWTHVGSSTTFGLGRYIIEPVTAGDRVAEARG